MKVKRQTLARAVALGAATLGSGCSLIYNVDSLPTPSGDSAQDIDAPPPPDVLDPNALMLTEAGPPDLYEGQGANGSPQAFLVLVGSNIADNAEITLVSTSGDPLPMYTLDLAHVAHAADNSAIAIPVTLPIDASAAATDVKVTVHVKQTGKLGDVTADLADQVTIHTLPELTDANPVVPASTAPLLYSQVVLTTPVVIPAVSGGKPTIIHSMSNVAMVDITSNALGQTPGRGGNGGGAGTSNGLGPGGGAGNGLGLIAAGSGGGFGTAGGNAGNGLGGVAGDPLITSYVTNASSGGGGGTGVAGGGGGGTIEVHAEGSVTVGKITANGAAGASTSALASGGGGGGSGGAIVVRAGGTATFNGALSVAGASGGTGGALGATGSAGGAGRIRIDASMIAGTTPAFSDTIRQGVAFDPSTPLITRDKRISITLNSLGSSDAYQVVVFKDAKTTAQPMDVTVSTPKRVVSLDLFDGYNKICVTPKTVSPVFAGRETNCVEVAYVRFDGASGEVTRGRPAGTAAPAARRLR